MRSRLDDLITVKFETFTECCAECKTLYIFEEARVKGRYLEILLLCPECGHRKKIALHSWYERKLTTWQTKLDKLSDLWYNIVRL